MLPQCNKNTKPYFPPSNNIITIYLQHNIFKAFLRTAFILKRQFPLLFIPDAGIKQGFFLSILNNNRQKVILDNLAVAQLLAHITGVVLMT